MILLCFIFTISTAFEYQLKSKDLSVDRSGKPCNNIAVNLPIRAKENNGKTNETTHQPENYTVRDSAVNNTEDLPFSIESLTVENLIQNTMLNIVDKSQEDFAELNNTSNYSRTSNVSCHDVSTIDWNLNSL
jgi:hypothetical protein